jgi:hypothetical protein
MVQFLGNLSIKTGICVFKDNVLSSFDDIFRIRLLFQDCSANSDYISPLPFARPAGGGIPFLREGVAESGVGEEG